MTVITKTIRLYKEQGFLSVLAAILNYFFSHIFGIRFSRTIGKELNPMAKKIFQNRALKESGGGYFYLNPMPTEDELEIYYSNHYWDTTNKHKKYGLNLRDIIHFQILKEYIPDFMNSKGKVIVNFGAGHGGISNLLWLEEFEIINVEPSEIPNSYNTRWRHVRKISEIADSSVDLIYGSHSLEHIQNIDAFKSEVGRVLKPGGYMFWEVPNAKCPTNGAKMNRIDIPHTYYFKESFFESWFDDILLNSSFDQTHALGIVENWDNYKNSDGAVIRALGKMV